MTEREDRPGILGTFAGIGIVGVIGTIVDSCGPDWKTMPSPGIVSDNCRLVISDKIEPDKKYVDVQPFGNIDYIIDHGCEREPNSNDRAEFARLYWIAKKQGLLKD